MAGVQGGVLSWKAWREGRRAGRQEPDHAGLVFEFSPQWIGRPLEDFQEESALASSVYKRLCVENEKGKLQSDPALFRCLNSLCQVIIQALPEHLYGGNVLYWLRHPLPFSCD